MIPIYVCQQQNQGPYGETHDCLDRKWWSFLVAADFHPILLPNDPNLANKILEENLAEAALLTGGGEFDLAGLDQRSATEKALMAWSITKQRPLIGVCRGMQAMLQYCGASLEKVTGHVMPQQKITYLQQPRWVNSFHQFGHVNVPENFDVLAVAADNVIKAVKATDRPWLGIMWHPERMTPFQIEDQTLFYSFIEQELVCKR